VQQSLSLTSQKTAFFKDLIFLCYFYQCIRKKENIKPLEFMREREREREGDKAMSIWFVKEAGRLRLQAYPLMPSVYLD
jgi:hypothetical protein